MSYYLGPLLYSGVSLVRIIIVAVGDSRVVNCALGQSNGRAPTRWTIAHKIRYLVLLDVYRLFSTHTGVVGAQSYPSGTLGYFLKNTPCTVWLFALAPIIMASSHDWRGGDGVS